MGRVKCSQSVKFDMGYTKLKVILEQSKFPVTVDINSFDKDFDARRNGRFTIHAKDERCLLKCVTNDNETLYLNEDDITKNSFIKISIDHSRICSTVNEIKELRKREKFDYFAATKPFSIGHVSFHQGQIFTFSTQNVRLLSFRREKLRGIHVQTYPNKKKIFLPMLTEGDFVICGDPNTDDESNIIHSNKEVQAYILVDKRRDMTQTYYVTDAKLTEAFYGSKKMNGELGIHMFTLSSFAHGRIISEAKPVDTLDTLEMDGLFKLANEKISNQDLFEGFYKIFPYSELGIIRLLDEILMELNQKFSRNPANDKLVLASHSLRRISLIETQLVDTTEKKLALSAAGDESSFYVNDNSLKDSIKKELCVEFDNGGYVIIPYTGSHPKIKFENISTCNVAYNYNIAEPKDISPDEHEYTYVDFNKHSDVPFRDRIPPTNSYSGRPLSQRVRTELLSQCGASATNHFRLPENLSKQYLKDLLIHDVIVLLESLQLKSYIQIFKDKEIDGNILVLLEKDDLEKLGMNSFEVEKILLYITGWRPLKTKTSNSTWLTTLPVDWSVNDVSRYLLHINMRSLQRFSVNQNIDGYLLSKITVNKDVIQTLKSFYGISISDKDLERLKKQILDDGKPKFKYLR